jgi:OOP family OmpA-OmpF porin
MKKTLLASLLIAAAAIPFSAQAQQGYIGIAAGQANNSIDGSGQTITSRDEKKTAYKIYGGYDFSKNWGVEVGYADLGNPRITYLIGGVSVNVTGKVSSIYVAGTGTLPINDMFSLRGKLGLAMNHVSATASAGGVTAVGSGNKSSPLIGIGATYNINKNVAVTADFEDFGKTASDARANMWSVGLRYNF